MINLHSISLEEFILGFLIILALSASAYLLFGRLSDYAIIGAAFIIMPISYAYIDTNPLSANLMLGLDFGLLASIILFLMP